jgi:hypothetical protein
VYWGPQLIGTCFIPIALVATASLEGLVLSWLKRTPRTALLLAGFLLVNSLTSTALFAQAVWEVAQGEHRTDVGLLEAYEWLDRHTQPREVVLASAENSQLIARYTHDAVVCGNVFLTVEVQQKADEVYRFFQPVTPAEFRRDLLRRYRVGYLFWGKVEKASGGRPGERGGFDPGAAPFLRKVFANSSAAIYKVLPEQPP